MGPSDLPLLRSLPATGSLTLNGAPLDALAGADVRSAIGLLAQDAHIFDPTIAENLGLARPAAQQDELWQALRSAGLAEWVADLAGCLEGSKAPGAGPDPAGGAVAGDPR